MKRLTFVVDFVANSVLPRNRTLWSTLRSRRRRRPWIENVLYSLFSPEQRSHNNSIDLVKSARVVTRTPEAIGIPSAEAIGCRSNYGFVLSAPRPSLPTNRMTPRTTLFIFYFSDSEDESCRATGRSKSRAETDTINCSAWSLYYYSCERTHTAVQHI